MAEPEPNQPVRILGLDPGLQVTGYGVLEMVYERLKLLGATGETIDIERPVWELMVRERCQQRTVAPLPSRSPPHRLAARRRAKNALHYDEFLQDIMKYTC